MRLSDRDHVHVWHPCSQMKDYEDFPPLDVVGASGRFIEIRGGQKLFDASSSWWCKSLGHGHPKIKAAVAAQMDKFEHVIFANTTNSCIVELSEKLCALCPGLDKVFYGGDGSTAVEIALKMSVHAQKHRGQPQRNKFAALSGGYHGESALALAVSDLGLYAEPYAELCPEALKIGPIPYCRGEDDPLWSDAGQYWSAIEKQLNRAQDELAAIIFEPIVQGAGGMRIYSPDLLRRLRAWSSSRGVDLIADEIMTGFGRTGKMFACEHAAITPDYFCLSKGLTSGWLPFSAVLCKNETYELFYDDYDRSKAFLHSNTYSGNALGAAAAMASLRAIEEESVLSGAQELSALMKARWRDLCDEIPELSNSRHLGVMTAGDLIPEGALSAAKNLPKRLGYAVYRESVRRGALLRPLGDTIYWLPPLNTTMEEMEYLYEVTRASILAVLRA